MPLKTISVDNEAYRTLKVAKLSPRESFSAVIRRTVEPVPARNFGELLKLLREFEGRAVFTPAERTALRGRRRTAPRSRSRLDRPAHAS